MTEKEKEKIRNDAKAYLKGLIITADIVARMIRDESYQELEEVVDNLRTGQEWASEVCGVSISEQMDAFNNAIPDEDLETVIGDMEPLS